MLEVNQVSSQQSSVISIHLVECIKLMFQTWDLSTAVPLTFLRFSSLWYCNCYGYTYRLPAGTRLICPVTSYHERNNCRMLFVFFQLKCILLVRSTMYVVYLQTPQLLLGKNITVIVLKKYILSMPINVHYRIYFNLFILFFITVLYLFKLVLFYKHFVRVNFNDYNDVSTQEKCHN